MINRQRVTRAQLFRSAKLTLSDLNWRNKLAPNQTFFDPLRSIVLGFSMDFRRVFAPPSHMRLSWFLSQTNEINAL